MALLEPLFKVAEICAFNGIRDTVVCPGSRSAALTLAFSRNKNIKTHVIPDERSAAYVALGLAQISKKPVVLICTSGTAALNFGPAVAEAFFLNVPLLILTADRPPEWISQQDGQTVFQNEIYGRHTLANYTFPADYSHPDSQWQIDRISYEALAKVKSGPVHINVPIREPFYPKKEDVFDGKVRKVQYLERKPTLSGGDWDLLLQTWNNVENILIAVGQNHEDLDVYLGKLSKEKNVSVLAEITANVNLDSKIASYDTFLSKISSNQKPDLLITAGKSFVSKPFKQFFRKHKPVVHWHIRESLDFIDPLQSISHKIPVTATYFFEELCKRATDTKQGSPFWKYAESNAQKYLKDKIENVAFGELAATFHILNSMESNTVLHIGNSMPIRYANLLSAFLSRNILVFSNRGTSGIDGIVSTSKGHALGTDKQVNCLVGDVSFFYDSNALFSAKTTNHRVFLINNSGGNIFRIIDGPKSQKELESHFVVPNTRNAENLCKDAGYAYFPINSLAELRAALNKKEDKAALFEIFVDGEKDAEVFQQLKAGFSL